MRLDSRRPGQSAAFFDLDKTVIAKASLIAFSRPFYREGLVTRRLLARGLWGQMLFTALRRRRTHARPATAAHAGPHGGVGAGAGQAGHRRHPPTSGRPDHVQRGRRTHRRAPGRRAGGCTSSRPHPKRSWSHWPATSAPRGLSPPRPPSVPAVTQASCSGTPTGPRRRRRSARSQSVSTWTSGELGLQRLGHRPAHARSGGAPGGREPGPRPAADCPDERVASPALRGAE